MRDIPIEGTIRKITAMPRAWWILYQWINITEIQDKEPRYLYSGWRPIEDRKAAADNFDAALMKVVG